MRDNDDIQVYTLIELITVDYLFVGRGVNKEFHWYPHLASDYGSGPRGNPFDHAVEQISRQVPKYTLVIVTISW